MSEEPAIDPRYDPAFQRGFTGAGATTGRADAARRPASALHRPAAAASSSAPAAASASTRIPERTAASASRFASIDGRAEGGAETRVEGESPTAASTDPAPLIVAAPALRPPWTNPFAVAVAVLGVAVLALGVWVMQETYRLMESEGGFQSQVDYWFLQSGLVAGPIFVGLGIAILVAVLMLCAAYWARLPDAAADADEEFFARS